MLLFSNQIQGLRHAAAAPWSVWKPPVWHAEQAIEWSYQHRHLQHGLPLHAQYAHTGQALLGNLQSGDDDQRQSSGDRTTSFQPLN